ncbi:protein kinase [Candidatus Uabimicrobium sp. HlEnr_7]|uniref:serine/threonine protein kinase n=1 Tax=Candidatus Uabimicrobium helgolandensis TaxID=3095367 RepID=UPI00355892E4
MNNHSAEIKKKQDLQREDNKLPSLASAKTQMDNAELPNATQMTPLPSSPTQVTPLPSDAPDATPLPFNITTSSEKNVQPQQNKTKSLGVGNIIDGKYKIISELGRGGLGIVFKVEHEKLPNRKQFALKILQNHLSQKKSFRDRFLREVMVAMEFTHEHAIQIRDFGEHSDGSQYFTMDYSSGLSLYEIIKRDGILPEKRALRITRQILLALKFSHSKNIIHRDLKPQNIIIENRETEHALVLDFGLAKIINTPQDMNLTGEAPVGTPYYMSPEQAKNLVNIDHRTDIYSTGIILYQMLTNSVPFSGSYWNIIIGHTDRVPTSPKEINNKISSSVEKIILKALTKERDKRYLSSDQFIKDIDNIYKLKDVRKVTFTKIAIAIIATVLVFLSGFLIYNKEVNINKSYVQNFYSQTKQNQFDEAKKTLTKISESWLNKIDTRLLVKFLHERQTQYSERKTEQKLTFYLQEVHANLEKSKFSKAISYLKKIQKINTEVAKEPLHYAQKFEKVNRLLQAKKWSEAVDTLTDLRFFYEKHSPPIKIPFIEEKISICKQQIEEKKRQIRVERSMKKFGYYLDNKQWLQAKQLVTQLNEQLKTKEERLKWNLVSKDYPPVTMDIYWKKNDISPWQKATTELWSGSFYQIRVTTKTQLYVYGFQSDSSGKIQKMFPNKKITKFSFVNPVSPGEFFIPAPGSAFRLDNIRGKEYFYLLFSNTELVDPLKYVLEYIKGKKTNSVEVIGPFDHK